MFQLPGFTPFLICLVALLSACSSNKLVKTYPGEQLTEQAVGVLIAPEQITVLSVNGSPVTQYLLSNLEVRYALKEGENLVVFQYESIWSRARRDEETGSRVNVVKSEPLEVLIDVKAGEHYRFNFSPVSNQKEAEALAESFIARIVDAQRNLVAESVAAGTYEQAELMRVKTEKTLLANKSAEKSEASLAETETVIDRLKALWGEASSEEKKAFMVWVFQE
jgi:uncharacterized protein YccT (UPF0319 family)